MKEHLAVYDGLPALSLESTHLVEMRRAGELYVDKTGQIQRLLDESARQVFVARPRRFGKSLMLSTIECMYQGHMPEVQTLGGDPIPDSQLPTVADRELFVGTSLVRLSKANNPPENVVP
ncbi:MAG: AAA family ATPase [Caldilineaceae bacterium]|nr:AAA family ATPase [Caldilineaceae bacterium]